MIEIGLVEYTPKEFVLEVKDKLNNVKAKYCINDKDRLVESLMEEHYVEFSFELDSFVGFVRSDYILYNGIKYILRKDVTPNKVNAYQYKYELKFEAEEMLLKDADLYYLEQGLKESSWNLTATADTFIQIIIDNANRYFSTDKFEVGVVQPTGLKFIEFSNVKAYEGLTQVAEVFKAEFLFEGYTLHLLNKANLNKEIELKTDVSLAKIEPSETTPNLLFNRIIPLGSERNLPRNYREVAIGESVDAIYQKRLRMPLTKGEYIDAKENMTPEEVIEGVVVFDEVYPKRIGIMSDITTKEYSDKDEETGDITKWKAYRYKDSDLKFSSDYLIDDNEIELRIAFQSGVLMGMDFAVRFNPDKYNENDPKAQIFEIIRNEDYSTPLPNDRLYPANGDTYILYGYDIKLIDDKLIPEAEEELYQVAKQWIEDTYKDTKVYECPTLIKYFADNKLDLQLAQKVKLVDDIIDGGSRSSRVLAYEKKLINIYDATYTIGDNVRYSNLGSLRKELENLKADQYYIANEASNKTPVITRFDNAKPSDTNVLSSLKALETFHRKDQTDETNYLQKYNKGIEVGGFIDSMSHGKGAGIDEHGNAQFESIASRSSIITQEFIFNRLQANESDSVYTESGVIESVSEIEENTFLVQFKKRWETDFIAFHKDDILRGVVNTLTQGGAYYTSYVRVLDVNTSSNQATILVYPDSEVPAQRNYPPTELMIMHRWGNVTDISRQTTWFTSSREGRIMFLNGVRKPILEEENYAAFWGKPLKLKAFEDKPINYEQPYLYARGALIQDLIRVDYQGNPIIDYRDRGKWEQGKEYTDGRSYPYEGDDVWHLDCRWRCIVENTTQEPSWNATDWVMVSGNEKLSLELYSDGGNIYRPNTSFKINIEAKVFMGNEDITAFIDNSDWKWTRETGNINGDNSWNEKHAGTTHQLTITEDDMEDLADYTKFICTAYVRDGKEIKKIEKEIRI